jgi:hypothetical protein
VYWQKVLLLISLEERLHILREYTEGNLFSRIQRYSYIFQSRINSNNFSVVSYSYNVDFVVGSGFTIILER